MIGTPVRARRNLVRVDCKLNQPITLTGDTVTGLLRWGRGSVLGACSAFLASQPSLVCCLAASHTVVARRILATLGESPPSSSARVPRAQSGSRSCVPVRV